MEPAPDFQALFALLTSEQQIAQRTDLKALILLVILGIVVIFFMLHLQYFPLNGWMAGAVLGYCLMQVIALVTLLLVVIPRLSQLTQYQSPAESMPNPMFFGGIAKFAGPDAYADCLLKLFGDPMVRFRVFSHSIYALGLINARKYRYLHVGMTAFAIALGLELFLVLSIYLRASA